MKEEIKFYKEPQKESFKAISSFTLFYIAWVYIFSYIYGVFIAFSPLTYFNIFICFGFGIALFLGLRIGANIFPLAKKSTIILLSGIFSVLACYVSWAFYMLYFISENTFMEFSIFEILEVLKPNVWLDIILQVNEQGLWSIFGATFTGSILWIIWFFEVLIIVVTSIGLSSKLNLSPYSTIFDKPYKKLVLNKDFQSIISSKKLMAEISKNPTEAIQNLSMGKASMYSKISIFYLEKEEKQFITIENVRPSSNGHGLDKTIKINLQEISTKDANNILQSFNHKEIKLLHF